MTPHGSASTYVNHGCRCQDCRTAHAAAQLRQWESRKRRLEADPTLAQHGRYTTYCNWACRCDECTAAMTAYCRKQRAT